MAVLYRDANPLDVDPRIEKWYVRLHKYYFIVPFFPKDVDHKDKWWYKLGFSAVWISSIWFFVLSLYFIYLALINQFDWYYIAVAAGWIVVGVVFPAGAYRLLIYYLTAKKKIY